MDPGDGEEWCDLSGLSQTNPLDSMQGVASMNKNSGKVHSCLVCGKVYKYLVSFRKHQRQHESKSPPGRSADSLNKYECQECGMSFIRRVRLLTHLRVHRSLKAHESKPLTCDQCDKTFTDVQSWMSHNELHDEKPFWCYNCGKGFSNEKALNQHLQRHNQSKHTCNICHKSFLMVAELRNHHKTHAGVKSYQCSTCGKAFSYLGHLISHRKKHLKVYGGSSGKPLGMKNSLIFAKRKLIRKKSLILTSIKQEKDPAALAGEEECLEKRKPLHEEDHTDSEDSDCGEPTHYLKRSNERKAQETHMHSEHKYWEWDCCVCDMGFDEVEQLHMHYIKHATGELPIPLDNIED